jgi:AcrR family transcriptional regulator
LVAKQSLKIIDDEGLDALSLERLAQELGVRAPSLYHHFRDKNAILAEVARLIVLETKVPKHPEDPDDWKEWCVALTANFRRAILRHHNAAPVLLQFLPRDLLTDSYENTVRYLVRAGVPAEDCILVLDGLDRLTLGGAIAEAMRQPRKTSEVDWYANPREHPQLVQVLDANPFRTEELFAEGIRRFLDGAVPSRKATSSRRRVG